MAQKRNLPVVEWTANQMATLDAAGYGIIMMRCSQEPDIRRVIGRYAFRQNTVRTKYPCKDSPESYDAGLCTNILEATALGTVRRFEEAFQWKSHGLDSQNQVPYQAEMSLMTALTNCTRLPARMEHRLIYIPNARLLTGDDGDSLQYRLLLKDLARLKAAGKSNALVVIGCTNEPLCQELIGVSYILDIPYPDTQELTSIIRKACMDCDGGMVSLSVSRINSLAEVMRGLREDDVRRIIDLAFASDEAPTAGNAAKLFQAARDAKEQMIAGVTGLKWLKTDADIGGLKTLRAWLENKRWIFQYPRTAQLQMATSPKGVLLCGLPGCGKTTLARLTAQLLGENGAPLPLVQMDISQLKGKYVGESEANCETALRTVESVAPCVLLIDEIEKVFGSVGTDGAHETTMHMFSIILDWMQKRREKPIFIIATANKTEKLPPELTRKGRFDEIFFVGVPCEAECREIFRVHLNKKRNVMEYENWEADSERIITRVLKRAAQLERFLNGADIESIVDGAFCELFVDSMKTLTKEKLEEIDGATEPFVRYDVRAVEQKLISVLTETRSYFDNNMENTAVYWLDMYRRQFREAGGGDGRVILPAEKEIFDPKTFMFDVALLKERRLLDEASELPKKRNDPEAYERWLQLQLQKAHDESGAETVTYDRVFRWRLAREIFHLRTG